MVKHGRAAYVCFEDIRVYFKISIKLHFCMEKEDKPSVEEPLEYECFWCWYPSEETNILLVWESLFGNETSEASEPRIDVFVYLMHKQQI